CGGNDRGGQPHGKVEGEIDTNAPKESGSGAVDSGSQKYKTVAGEIDTTAEKTRSVETSSLEPPPPPRQHKPERPDVREDPSNTGIWSDNLAPSQPTDANPLTLPCRRDVSQRDPIRSMDEQSLREQANSRLASVEAIDSFQKNVVSHIEGWEPLDNSQIEARAAAKRTLEARRDQLMKAIEHKYGPDAVRDFNQSDKMREQLQNNPAVRADYEKYLLARDAHAVASKEPRDSILDRKRQLESDVNQYLKSQGLPAVTISTALELGDEAAHYQPGRGVILVREADLRGNTIREEFAGSVMHELAHSEQDGLVILKNKQEAGIQGTPTDAQITLIADKHSKNVGPPVSEDHIRAVLAARGDVPLSPVEMDRARSLEVSLADAESSHRLRNDL